MSYSKRNKILDLIIVILVIGIIVYSISNPSEPEPIVEEPEPETVTVTDTVTETVRGAISLPYVPTDGEVCITWFPSGNVTCKTP